MCSIEHPDIHIRPEWVAVWNEMKGTRCGGAWNPSESGNRQARTLVAAQNTVQHKIDIRESQAGFLA
jgi:hypothetical protein